MNQIDKSKYLKGRELKKIKAMDADMQRAESIDKLAWVIIGLCIVAFIFFGSL